MSLQQKGTYAPPLDKVRGLNIHDGKKAFGPHMIKNSYPITN
jgi:hypothetical protein